MVLEKPLVTSKTLALQKYFTRGTLFVEPKAECIADGIRLAHEKRSQLKFDIKKWKQETRSDNDKKVQAIRKVLNSSGLDGV